MTRLSSLARVGHTLRSTDGCTGLKIEYWEFSVDGFGEAPFAKRGLTDNLYPKSAQCGLCSGAGLLLSSRTVRTRRRFEDQSGPRHADRSRLIGHCSEFLKRSYRIEGVPLP